MAAQNCLQPTRIHLISCLLLLSSVALITASICTDKWFVISGDKCGNVNRYWKGLWVECVNFQKLLTESRVPSCIECRWCPCPCNYTQENIQCSHIGVSDNWLKKKVYKRYPEPRGKKLIRFWRGAK